VGTPPPFLATPSPPGEGDQTGPFATPGEAATPDAPFLAGDDQGAEGTPDSGPDATEGSTESEDGGTGTTTGPTFGGSDGTSGATPAVDGASGEDTGAEGTPSADGTPFFVREETTPVPDGTPQVGELDELPPFPVDGCEVAQVPPFSGQVTEFVTVSDVNFRTGPGADCDSIGDAPLVEGTDVTLLSGPVVRSDDDEFIWVQVEIDGEVGWLVTSAITPVP